LFGWKAPYTIGNSIGIVFSLLVFILSDIGFSSKQRSIPLLILLCGIFAVSSKIEYAFITIAYLLLWFSISIATDTSIKYRREKLFAGSALILALCVISYINWMKLLPPYMRLTSWCSDPLSYMVFLRETVGGGQARSGIISNHSFEILGAMDFGSYRLLNVAVQVLFCMLLAALPRTGWIPEYRRRRYGIAISIVYWTYLGAIAALDRQLILRDVALIAFTLAIIQWRRIINDRNSLYFSIFALLFTWRTMWKIEFGFFSIFYMLPVVVLFLSLVRNVLNLRSICYLFAILFSVSLGDKIWKAANDEYRFETKATSKNGESFQIPLAMRPLLEHIRQLDTHKQVRSISSAKNLPFLNVFFNHPNPVKKFFNVEPYPIGYREFYGQYLETLKKAKPDVFVYMEPIMHCYITQKQHQNLPEAVFLKHTEAFIVDLRNIYTRETVIDPVSPQGSQYTPHIRVYTGPR
jgi:hypothetical protein